MPKLSVIFNLNNRLQLLKKLKGRRFIFPLCHPAIFTRNYEADMVIQEKLFGVVDIDTNFNKFKRIIKRLIRYNPSLH